VKLPFAELAIIPAAKLTDYLLSSTHPQGSSKAAFFLHLGFSRERTAELHAALPEHAAVAEMTEIRTAYGPKYVLMPLRGTTPA
jgi:hypothetical protein